MSDWSKKVCGILACVQTATTAYYGWHCAQKGPTTQAYVPGSTAVLIKAYNKQPQTARAQLQRDSSTKSGRPSSQAMPCI
jgi:hypothetical protein